MPTTILIDAKNALYRFGYAYAGLTNSEGQATGALHGVLMALLRLKKRHPDAVFLFVWDGPGKSWRHKYFPEYKSNRGKPTDRPTKAIGANERTARIRPNTEVATGADPRTASVFLERGRTKDAKQEQLKQAVFAQEVILRDLVGSIGIPSVLVPKVEADDLIGIIAVRIRSFAGDVIVYSSDKDFMQLMSIGVSIIKPVPFAGKSPRKEDRLAPETPESVLKRFGCVPEDILKVRAYAGDHSDAIPPAIPGIGEKRALLCLKAGADPSQDKVTCSDIKLYGRLRSGWADVRRNYRLMQIAAFPQPELFGRETANEIHKTLHKLGNLVNFPKPKPEDEMRAGYEQFIANLLRYDLEQALGNRLALWSIQCEK